MQKIYLPSELYGCLSGLEGIMPSRIDSVCQSASSPLFHKMKLTTISSSYFIADVYLDKTGITSIDYTTINVKIKELCKIQFSKIVKNIFLDSLIIVFTLL